MSVRRGAESDLISTPAATPPVHARTDRQFLTVAAVSMTVLCWALAFPAIRAGLRGFTPADVALLRYLTASFVLGALAVVMRMPLPRRQDLPGLAACGFVGFTLYNLVLNAGEISVPSGVASLLVNSGPVFTALLATAFLGERLRPWGWPGSMISFVGAAVITLGAGQRLSLDPRALLVLSAALAQSVYFVMQKPYLTRYSALQFTSYAVWAGTFFLLVFTPSLLSQIRVAPTAATAATIYMGIFPGALGYACWAFALSRMPASRAGTFLYLVPGVSFAIAWVWLGEVPSLVSVLGGVLVLSGVILVNTRRRSETIAITSASPMLQGCWAMFAVARFAVSTALLPHQTFYTADGH